MIMSTKCTLLIGLYSMTVLAKAVALPLTRLTTVRCNSSNAYM